MHLRLEHVSSFVTAVFNSLLHSLLDSILEVRCPFDESGLYRLFRVILHLQEFVLSTKKLLQSEGFSFLANTLLSNLSGWRRAEFAVAVLNNEVFRGTAGKKQRWSRTRDATPVTVTMKNTRRRRSGGFLTRFCCVSVAAQEAGSMGSPEADWPERDGIAELELPEALHQRMRFALIQRSSQQRVATSEQQQIALLLPMLRPSWAGIVGPTSTEGHEDDDMREERRRWASLVAPNASSARRILDSVLWGTWRRSHRGTVFVELKMDVTDI
eukprot:gene31986-41485_t